MCEILLGEIKHHLTSQTDRIAAAKKLLLRFRFFAAKLMLFCVIDIGRVSKALAYASMKQPRIIADAKNTEETLRIQSLDRGNTEFFFWNMQVVCEVYLFSIKNTAQIQNQNIKLRNQTNRNQKDFLKAGFL